MARPGWDPREATRSRSGRPGTRWSLRSARNPPVKRASDGRAKNTGRQGAAEPPSRRGSGPAGAARGDLTGTLALPGGGRVGTDGSALGAALPLLPFERARAISADSRATTPSRALAQFEITAARTAATGTAKI